MVCTLGVECCSYYTLSTGSEWLSHNHKAMDSVWVVITSQERWQRILLLENRQLSQIMRWSSERRKENSEDKEGEEKRIGQSYGEVKKVEYKE